MKRLGILFVLAASSVFCYGGCQEPPVYQPPPQVSYGQPCVPICVQPSTNACTPVVTQPCR